MTIEQRTCPCGRTHFATRKLARQGLGRYQLRHGGRYAVEVCPWTLGAWTFRSVLRVERTRRPHLLAA